MPLLPLQPLAADHPAAALMSKQLKRGEPLSVPRAALGQYGLCYWNVRDVAQANGGKMVLGWQLSWLPEVFVEAMHHSVWETPDGQLVDVSKASDGRIDGSTTFVVDPSVGVDLNYPVLVEHRHLQLVPDPDVEALIKAYRANNTHQRRAVVLHKKQGYKWNRADGSFSGPLPPAQGQQLQWDIHNSYLALQAALEKVRLKYAK